jgi:hypothetical protein
MKCRLLVAFALLAVNSGVALGQGDLILPARRVDLPNAEQAISLRAEVAHYTQGGELDTYQNAAETLIVGDATAGLLKGQSVQVFAQATGQSSCDVAPGNVSYAGEVNTLGSISGHVQKGTTNSEGSSQHTIVNTTALSQFLIERHPGKDSMGSEFGDFVTVVENMALFVYGGISGQGTLNPARTATVGCGNSGVTAVNWGATGWTVFGQLQQSDRENPGEGPIFINENHGGGLDVLYVGTQASLIGNTVNLVATMVSLDGYIARGKGSSTGTHSMMWNYSLAAWITIYDIEL